MRTGDFGRAVMPALASNAGLTRLAAGSFDQANNPTGVDVWQFPAGHPDQAVPVRAWRGAFRGDPALSPDGRLVAFFVEDGSGRAFEIDSGRLVWVGPRLEGNHALKLRDTSVVFQTRDGIFEQDFDGSASRRLGDYSATGLAYLPTGGYVTWEQNRIAHDPMMIPAPAGDLLIGVSHWTGGLLAKLHGTLREFHRGEEWNDPAACVEGPGRYAFAAWMPFRVLRVWCASANEITAWPVYRETPEPVPVPPPEPPKPEPPKEEPVLNIESAIELIGVQAREIDQRQPGLRSSDLERYTALVASACYAVDPRIGRKRADPGRPISKSALGVRHDVSREGMTVLTAVDFVRDESDAPESEWGEPGNRNHIRSQPFLDGPVTQFWIRPEPLASEPKPQPKPEPQPPAVCNCAAELAALQSEIAELAAALSVVRQAAEAAYDHADDAMELAKQRPSGGTMPTKLRVVGVTFDVEAV